MPNALELRFSQRCLESGDTDRSLSDIQEHSISKGKDVLRCCLKLLPKTIVGQALVAKEADCEHKHLSTLAMIWAAEVKDRDKQLCEMLIEEELTKYAISAAEVSILQKVLVGHSVEELEAAMDSHNAVTYLPTYRTAHGDNAP
ncbi:hypothetical protein EDB19DRAFT_1839608 [Suillus lakei]|nr:hypothetical protein EDB19DRAFT_1839608 [Suillus lakei]